jgi:dipeptidase
MCDTLVSLTDTGVLFAKNSDRDANEEQRLVWVPALDHEPGERVRATWSAIPQVAHTNAVVLSQPWWMWGAEIGANEHGVVIGNEAVFTRLTRRARRAHLDGALLGMDLLRLALERATNTHEAVGVIVELLERHGQGGPCSHDHPRFTYDNSFIVADPNGAIVLETAGRHWATEPVAGPGRSISNGLTIPDFARRFADPIRGRVARCALRQARTTAAAAHAVGPLDLMTALRDHGPTGTPQWSRASGALSAPCAHSGGTLTATQTTASWVADLTGARAQHWATATSAPCTSIFLPVDLAAPAGGALYSTSSASNTASADSYWWQHEQLHRLALRDWSASTARFAAERDLVQRSWITAPPSTAAAVATARDVRARWLADLHAAALPDRRPRWLRQHWSHLAAASSLPRLV